MAINIKSATNLGIESLLINVEVQITTGLPMFNIVGLPSTSIKESKERVRAAILNSGFKFPLGRITVNLSPADIKKIGSLLDLPIALGILYESKQIKGELQDILTFGELSLSGELQEIKGVVSIILEGLEKNIKIFIGPKGNKEEINVVKKGEIFLFNNLRETVEFIENRDLVPFEFYRDIKEVDSGERLIDGIIGLETSKRALEIGATGRHNIIFFGAPGSGKTMLARALKGIMPELTEEERLEVFKIYSASGRGEEALESKIPFRSPHHTITRNGLVGGGTTIKAGEITLAHNGILFLDEILEFRKEVLEALRAPMEEGYVNIDRVLCKTKMPSKFLLVGSLNLCPCGKYTLDFNSDNRCTCSYNEIRRYQNRLSKAIRDRIDIFNYVPKIDFKDLSRENQNNSKEILKKIARGRAMQRERFKGTDYNYNSELKGKDIFEMTNLTPKGEKFLKIFFEKTNSSIRSYGKAIKLARTIADIEQEKFIEEEFLMEALNFRKDINGEFM